MKNIVHSLLAILVTVATTYTPATNAQSATRVAKVRGDVEIRDVKGQSRGAAKVGATLKAGDSLHTTGNGTAALKTSGGDVVVVSKDSAVRLKDDRNAFEQLIGKVLYFFRSSKQTDRRVELQTAILGIRGTEFLVDTSADRSAVALKEGALEVDSKQGGFNVYRRNEADEFEAFKREAREALEKERAEFEQYKSQIREEFVAFQKSLKLESHQSLTLGDGKATVGGIDPRTEDSMRELAKFSEELR